MTRDRHIGERTLSESEAGRAQRRPRYLAAELPWAQLAFVARRSSKRCLQVTSGCTIDGSPLIDWTPIDSARHEQEEEVRRRCGPGTRRLSRDIHSFAPVTDPLRLF